MVFTSAIMLWACSKNEPQAPAQQSFQYKDDIGITLTDETHRLCYDPRNVDLISPCYTNYDPVCACEVITFGNACTAEAYGFQNYTEGGCVEQKCVSEPIKRALYNTINCPAQPDYVCGCNGQTYRNECDALRNGVLIYYPGKCDEGITIDPDEIIEKGCFDPRDILSETECPMVLAPVCACGVIEFTNACMARAAGFQNYEQGGCVQNRCESNTLKGIYDKYPINCNNFSGPAVCGCDGNTYQNACFAISNGITAYYPGQCGSIHEDL